MKRIFCIIGLVFILTGGIMAQDSYVIETSRGPQRVVVPEDMTIEEAYLQVASLYLEERYDLEEVLIQVDSLVAETEEYLDAIDKKDAEIEKLNDKVSDLNTLLEESQGQSFFDNFTFSAGIGGGMNPITLLPYFEGRGGIIYKGNWTIGVRVAYPFQTGVYIGWLF